MSGQGGPQSPCLIWSRLSAPEAALPPLTDSALLRALPQDRVCSGLEVQRLGTSPHALGPPKLSLCPSPSPWTLERGRHFPPVLSWRFCLVASPHWPPPMLPISPSQSLVPALDALSTCQGPDLHPCCAAVSRTPADHPAGPLSDVHLPTGQFLICKDPN